MHNENYLVVGLGITGFAVVKYLIKHGKTVSVTDSRDTPPYLQQLRSEFPLVPVFLGAISVPAHITCVVLSPGLALTDPALASAHERKLPIIGDIELFAQVVDKPVLAITGSNGKSTVTTLLGLMAEASGVRAGVGGNLGTAALDLLDPANQCYILELSSFQLETTYSLRPLVATVLNVSPDHMDRYEDLAAYQQAKLRIYNNAQHVLYNRADSLTAPAGTIMAMTFGVDAPTGDDYGVINHSGIRWLARGNKPLMPIAEMGMLGEHNVANALAALAMGTVAGFDLDAMLRTLTQFKGLEHRCEHVLSANDVVWVNDSKGTNVAATVTAISGLAKSINGKWVIILGGLGKNADFRPLLEPVRDHCRAAILIGTEKQHLMELLGSTTKCFVAEDLAEVISIASQQAQSGDGVLLSPACASFDMFDNYEHRGEQFKQQVLQRIGKQHATTTTS